MAYFIVKKNCTNCENCLQVCMNGAIIDLIDDFYINPAWCNECGSCAAMCYENAIQYEGLDSIEDNILHEYAEDLTMYLLAE